MHELPDCKNHPQGQRVGIVGGGFSGTLVLANLIEQADCAFTVDLFEPERAPGTGVAYSTTETVHLLNVWAERMGAFAGQPDGFYRWLQSEPGQAATNQLGLTTTLKADSYAPRQLYGRYLRQVFAETLQQAKAKGITVHLHQATVTDVQPTAQPDQCLILTAAAQNRQDQIAVDALVLATGNRARRPAFLPQVNEAGARFVADVWHPQPAGLYPYRVADLGPDAEIVIVGTGLTMVDAVLTLQAHGYQGSITAISRHGWLPAVHAHGKPYPAWAWTLDPEAAPQTALGMFQGLRAEIAHAATLGYDWRSVIDSLRPITQTLWQRLDNGEKRKFLRRLFTLWNVHRHRMAHEVHDQLVALQQAGRLKLVAGKVCQITPTEQGLTLAYRPAHSAASVTVDAALVLNCTGPAYDSTDEDGLLANLRNRALITLGPLAIGVETAADGSAKGTVPGTIYPLGSLLVGELLECTAVPELREQAKAVAEQVLGRLAPAAQPLPVATWPVRELALA